MYAFSQKNFKEKKTYINRNKHTFSLVERPLEPI